MSYSALVRLGLCAWLVAFVPVAARANLLVNGSFESGTPAVSGGSITAIDPGGLAGWTVAPSVSGGHYWWYMSSGATWGVAQDGDCFLNPTYADESVAQSFAVTAGTSYIVSYYEALRKGAAGASDSMTASIALTAGGATGALSQVSHNVLDNSAVGNWQPFSFTFTPDTTTTATLRLVFNGDGPGYPVIDNVVVAVVPEPATLTLCGLGLLAACRPRRARR